MAKRTLGKHDRPVDASKEADLLPPPNSLRRKEQQVPTDANGLTAALLQLTGTVNRVLTKVEGQEKRIISMEEKLKEAVSSCPSSSSGGSTRRHKESIPLVVRVSHNHSECTLIILGPIRLVKKCEMYVDLV